MLEDAGMSWNLAEGSGGILDILLSWLRGMCWLCDWLCDGSGSPALGSGNLVASQKGSVTDADCNTITENSMLELRGRNFCNC